jgi:hypothetical protein
MGSLEIVQVGQAGAPASTAGLSDANPHGFSGGSPGVPSGGRFVRDRQN